MSSVNLCGHRYSTDREAFLYLDCVNVLMLHYGKALLGMKTQHDLVGFFAAVAAR